jgi:glycerol uptake facilitator-like aquaporin
MIDEQRKVCLQAIIPDGVYRNMSGGAHDLAPGVSPGQGVLCEVVLTTSLVLTVLMAAVDPKTKSPLAPLAIGFAVTTDIIAG